MAEKQQQSPKIINEEVRRNPENNGNLKNNEKDLFQLFHEFLEKFCKN